MGAIAPHTWERSLRVKLAKGHSPRPSRGIWNEQNTVQLRTHPRQFVGIVRQLCNIC